ncbi:MAG: benzoate-CoA ligase family protein, partial [Clostridia bacterium]|nr:benzoate-CoA ligase family protein [Clostridia bacterium]
ELTAAPTSKDDQALWLFTSGTTGKPKGVIHLHHDMEFCAKTFGANVLKLTSEDRIFCSSKLFFAYGLGNSLYFPLSFGASVSLSPDRTTPECTFAAIERFRPTVFFGVPTLYNALLRHMEKTGKKYDLSSIRVCISSAEPLPPPVLHKWQEIYGLKILDCIGCTESLHAFIANTNETFREGSSGKVVPGFEAKIVGVDGLEAPRGEIGDLWIKGDSIALGYFNKHEATKAKFIGEWLITGDKYYQDGDGFFFYCGRSDELMKVAGMWVSPHEIESCLLQLPYIHEAAVAGGTNENGLVKPKGFVVLKDNVEPGEKLKSEILSYLDDNLPTYKRLHDLAFMKELPKTATGKIQRFKLRDGI